MPKPGTTVETKVEYVTEDGDRKKKTTTTTTVVSDTPGGGYKTKTSTKIHTQSVDKGHPETDAVTTKLERMTTKDDLSDEEHDPKNDMSTRDIQNFRDDCVGEINECRKKHGAKKLNQSGVLTQKAQDHAVKMLKDNKLSTLEGVRLGQSLSMKMPRPSGEDVAKKWYDEGKDYNYKLAQFKRGQGNFTQIIWADCSDVGVGVASNKSGLTYTIALFDPPGNVQGQFLQNVKSKR